MAFFDNLTASLKQKWLPYYQENRAWITRQMAVDAVETPDGGRRPSSYLILGVISALEPELADLMLPFTKLNTDADVLVDVLELNFDPEQYLNNSFNSATATNPPAEMMAGLNTTNYATNPPAEMMAGLIDTAEELIVVAPDNETVVVIDATEDELNDLSLDEDEIASEESSQQEYSESSTTHSEASNDLLSDQWQQDTNSESEQAQDETPSWEKKQPEDEISRLFPNF